MEKQRDITVDLFRVIASVLVVLIHTTPNEGVPGLYFLSVTIGRYAVPFFMLVTGYFYFLHPSKDRLRKIEKNVLSLWLIWTIIYLPNGIYNISQMSNIKEIILKIVWSFWGENVCYGGGWYLIALAFGLFVVDFFRRKEKMWMCNLIALIVLYVDCASTNYQHIFPHFELIDKFYWATTIITGILWVTLAYYIADNYQKWAPKVDNVFFFILAILLTFGERLIIQNEGVNNDLIRTDMYLTLPISISLVFLFILNHQKLQPASKVVKYRDFATLLYFVQFGVLDCIKLHGAILFVVVLIVTSLISILIMILSKWKATSFLRKIY